MIIVRFAKIYPHKKTAAPNGAAVNRFSVVTPRALRDAAISQHIRTLCVAAAPPRAGVCVLSYPAAPGRSNASRYII
jgi:hypothetical protein